VRLPCIQDPFSSRILNNPGQSCTRMQPAFSNFQGLIDSFFFIFP
jgi:hypothetical protein